MIPSSLNTDAIINSLPGIFYLFDQTGCFILWNKNFESITGYAAKEIKKLHPLDLFEGEEKEYIQKRIHQVFESGHAVADSNLITKKKEVIPFHFTGFLVTISGKPHLMGMGINTSDKKTAETALQESQQSYEVLFSQSPLPQWLINIEDYRFVKVNQAAIRNYGYSEEEFMQLSVLDILTAEDRNTILDDKDSFPHTKTPFVSKWRHQKKGGEVIQTEVSSIKARYKGRDVLICIVNDITERTRLQEQLTASVIKAQERERAQLGQELHDNVNQILTTVKLYNEMFLTSSHSDPLLLQKSMHYLQVCIDEIRSISKRLSAPSLGKIHIQDSLQDLIEAVNLTRKLNVVCHVKGLSQTILPSDLHLAVYRIVQEQLNNIIKHAEASKVKINLTCHKKTLDLSIVDDGKGFNKEDKRTGIGLSNIESRAENMKGKLSIETAPGKGCKLTVKFPLSI